VRALKEAGHKKGPYNSGIKIKSQTISVKLTIKGEKKSKSENSPKRKGKSKK